MQASTNVRQTPPGRRAGRGSRVLLAVLAMLLLSLYALLEGGKTAKAIVGGTEVKDNATYPFMAQVWWTYPASDGKTTYTTLGCTGTLLDNNSVLTAAHCVTGLKPNTTISVVVGPRTANDTFHEGKDLSVAPQGQKFSVDTPLHICCETSDPKSSENYNVGDHLQPFDAAVINLSQPVTLPNVKPVNVKPIQLAKPSDGDNLEKKNAPATAAGWG